MTKKIIITLLMLLGFVFSGKAQGLDPGAPAGAQVQPVMVNFTTTSGSATIQKWHSTHSTNPAQPVPVDGFPYYFNQINISSSPAVSMNTNGYCGEFVIISGSINNIRANDSTVIQGPNVMIGGVSYSTFTLPTSILSAQPWGRESSDKTDLSPTCDFKDLFLGPGAYQILTLKGNTYYDFEWVNHNTIHGDVSIVSGGTGNHGPFTITANRNQWYSGTTDVTIKIWAVRNNCAWDGNGAKFSYKASSPTLTANNPTSATICTGFPVTLQAGTASPSGATIYWQNTNQNGTSTSVPISSSSVSSAGTYYYRANWNGCWSESQATVVTPGIELITVDAGPDKEICAGESVVLEGTGANPIPGFNYFEDFNGCNSANCKGWTINGGWQPGIDTWISCSNASANDNIYSGRPNSYLTSNGAVFISNGQPVTFSFNYKTEDHSSFNPIPAGYCTFYVQWSTDGVSWTTISTFNNQNNTNCHNHTAGFTPPAGQSVHLRVNAHRNNGDFDFLIDDISVSQAALPPTLTWSGGPILSGANTLTPTVNPTTTTTYTLTATVPGICPANDNVIVTVSPLDITGPSTICLGGTINYDAPGELPAGATFPTGGSISTFDNYRIHEFKNSGTFNPQGFAPLNVMSLVVGGGGGGNSNGAAGGGGAGGLVWQGSAVASSTSVTIGAGGIGGTGGGSLDIQATNGGNSSFGTIIAYGGGHGSPGGHRTEHGKAGGSGGGAASYNNVLNGVGGAGTPGQGHRGGNATTTGSTNSWSGGGGGGAGGPGQDVHGAGASVGGNGGIGLNFSAELGTSVGHNGWFAGGGSGAPNAAGGQGGGGTNGPGMPNTGGGGSNSGNAGGSGVVIVRYVVPKWSVTNGTGSATIDEITGELTPVAAGTVTVTFTNANGCEASKVVTIEEVSTPPTASTGGGNYCHGNVITLTQSGGTDNPNAVDVWYAASGQTSADPNSCDEGFVELWNRFEYNDPGCYYLHHNTEYNVNNGVLNVEAMDEPSGDPFIWMYPLPGNTTIDADQYKYVNVRYKVNSYIGAATPRMGMLFTKRTGPCGTNSGDYSGSSNYPFELSGQSGHQNKTINTDGNWHIISFPIHELLNWNGTVTGLRFDYFDPSPHVGNNGSSMEVDFITVSKHPMIGEGKTITLSPGDEHYPKETTTYYAKKIDNCGATSCVNETVVLPPSGDALAYNGETATCEVKDGERVHFYHASGRLITTIDANSGNLGEVTATAYVDPAPQLVQACDFNNYETSLMQRHWVITPTTQNPASVYLPFSNTEYSNLMGAANANLNLDDDINSIIDLKLSKYSGPNNVNDIYEDNCLSQGGNHDPNQPTPAQATTIHTLNGSGNITVANNFMRPISGAQFARYNIPGFSEFWLHGQSENSPLPVTLTDFSVSCDKVTTLKWTTASEQNSDKFIIEKSRDGVAWTFVAEQSGAGNSNTIIHYSQTDNNPWSGVYYYRLRQIDFDGKEEIYGPISVSCDGNGNNLAVYPNPNEGNFTVEIHSSIALENANLQLMDVTGKLVSSRIIQIENGVTQVAVGEKEYLNPGTYVLKVVSGEYFEPVKIVVR